MARKYKWHPWAGRRHAVPRSLVANDVGQTLCEIEMTAGPDRWPDATRYWPTCPECDLAWRGHEGLPPWPRKDTDQVAPSSGCRPGTTNDDNLIDMLSLVIDTLVSQAAGRKPSASETASAPSLPEVVSAAR